MAMLAPRGAPASASPPPDRARPIWSLLGDGADGQFAGGAITGQVPRAMIGRDAFQETDVIGITLPITKHSVSVMTSRRCRRSARSFPYRHRGTPRPVLIDIPKDVQNQKMEWDGATSGRPGVEASQPRSGQPAMRLPPRSASSPRRGGP